MINHVSPESESPGDSPSPQEMLDARLAAQVDELRESGLFRESQCVVPLPDGWCGVDGAKVRNVASNDYLNLAHDPRLIEAAQQALEESGVGSSASALISGRGFWQEKLESQLAEFEQTEAAIVFPTGYAANVGTLATLISAEDTIFCDRHNHASLVDGCRLSGARLRVYRHRQLDVLERELKKATAESQKWIVTDSVFSMDGLLAPLPELCDLAEKYGAFVIIDEAHGTGVFGEEGRGVAEQTGTEDRIAVRIGTLSKAVGCLGGFVSGSQSLIDVLRNSARTQMFSTALPAAICAAACRSLEIIQSEPGRRKTLHQLSNLLREELRHFEMPLAAEPHSSSSSAASMAQETVTEAQGPIVPVIVGDPESAVAIGQQLLKEGFLGGAIRPPTVPKSTSRLRLSLNAGLKESDVRALAVSVARAVAEATM